MSLEGAAGAGSPGLLGRQPPECHWWCQKRVWNEHHQGEGSLLTGLMPKADQWQARRVETVTRIATLGGVRPWSSKSRKGGLSSNGYFRVVVWGWILCRTGVGWWRRVTHLGRFWNEES